LRGTGVSRFARTSVVTGKLAAVDDTYGLTEIAHPAGTIWLTGRAGPVGREARVVVKATDITLAKSPAHDLSVRTTLAGTVTGIETDGALAGISIDLDGHGHLFALATRKAVDELELRPGARVYALVKAVALDERAVATVEA
jgi:molybdate transport system ATP-binding protein